MNTPLRFAILHHTGHGKPHYDLLFETSPGSMLAAWRSPHWPITDATPLTPLPDHRPLYLTYQGFISNHRGQVRRIAAGHHTIRQTNPALLVIELEDGTILRLPRQPANKHPRH